MKKTILTSILLLTVTMANAGEISWNLKFNPSLSLFGKLAEGAQNTGVSASVRDWNPGFEWEANAISSIGLGGGLNFFFMPGDWSLRFNNDSGSAAVYVFALTAGPRFYYQIGPDGKTALYGTLGLGWYLTDPQNISARTFNSDTDDKNSFGVNTGFGIEHQVSKVAVVGFKTLFHYLLDTGDEDDGIILSIGPTVGVKF